MTRTPWALKALGGMAVILPVVVALQASDADTMFNAWNNALLSSNGNTVFYKAALNSQDMDQTWTGSLDIMGAEDAYERTGDGNTKTLVNNLLNTWLDKTPPPWSWDGWNDDIGWFTLALIRGYQITGTQRFLDQAKYGFDYAYGRGWDTQYNGGGIWEENPEYISGEPHKEALSTNSLGKVACLIYQSTGDQSYMDKCRGIYDWSWNHLFDSTTGAMHTGIHIDGTVDTSVSAYNQGTWLDYANLVHKITGDTNVYNDAKRSIDYARASVTQSGIFTGGSNYNTWADEMARGVGNFVSDNGLWDEYYDWMVQNADAILQHRRTDIGLTWNAWDQQTPNDNSLIANKFVSAVAWLQYTPASKPTRVRGIHVVTNEHTGLALDTDHNDKSVHQVAKRGDQTQRWSFTQNSDDSWNIISLATWQAVEASETGTDIVQSPPTRNEIQRWVIDEQEGGTYKIWNKATGQVLGGLLSSTSDTGPHERRSASHQHWIIE
ncbi:hypothetical protein FE257_004505 [Aspergillus nanangensis]|uniref:Ricin B lectin domain-containing protein n=1 Tax=Aspergillus nanangensis TaxID=2582783 RepID=A0AAD4GYG3_ASPNN|nr:hypothetical protein FE257_004505 [Aspergillus nanangensis]